MLDFPKWFDKAIKVMKCSNCHQKMSKEHILAEGIRKSIVHENATAFFIEYKCPKCDAHITMELTKMTVEDFVMEMIDQFAEQDMNDFEGASAEEGYYYPEETDDSFRNEYDTQAERKKDKKRGRKNRNKSKIADNEFIEIKDIIKNCKTHEEFMLSIGITEDDIKKLSDEVNAEKNKDKKEVKKTRKRKPKKDVQENNE